MHKFELATDVAELVLKRRGRRHVYDRLDPKRTALVVIDLQNTFMKEGAVAEVPVARAIVPNVNRLAEALRQAGGVVVWIQSAMSRDGADGWKRLFDDLNEPVRSRALLEGLTEGSDGWQLWPTLDVREGDLLLSKNRYSAFLPGASDAPEVLQGRGIDTVLIAGTLTSICCESSARDAAMRDFKTVMVSDANAAITDSDHAAALNGFYRAFGDVLSVDQTIAALEAGMAAGVRAAE